MLVTSIGAYFYLTGVAKRAVVVGSLLGQVENLKDVVQAQQRLISDHPRRHFQKLSVTIK